MSIHIHLVQAPTAKGHKKEVIMVLNLQTNFDQVLTLEMNAGTGIDKTRCQHPFTRRSWQTVCDLE